MLTASKQPIQFGNILYGNEINAWDGTSFTAPVDGIYQFNLHLTLYSGGYARYYRIRAMLNDMLDDIDHLMENNDFYRSYYGNGYSHAFQVERQLNIGDTLSFVDYAKSDSQYDYKENSCKTNGESHSCSHITGRLIRKL